MIVWKFSADIRKYSHFKINFSVLKQLSFQKCTYQIVSKFLCYSYVQIHSIYNFSDRFQNPRHHQKAFLTVSMIWLTPYAIQRHYGYDLLYQNALSFHINSLIWFRKPYSCEIALQSLMNDWKSSIDEGEIVDWSSLIKWWLVETLCWK